MDSAELAASVAAEVARENAGHMSNRCAPARRGVVGLWRPTLTALCVASGATPPILAHGLQKGLGATRPAYSPASTPKRISMARKRGKSPGGGAGVGPLVTPRSPAFESMQEQVDSLTSQIRQTLSIPEQAELREQVLASLAQADAADAGESSGSAAQ